VTFERLLFVGHGAHISDSSCYRYSREKSSSAIGIIGGGDVGGVSGHAESTKVTKASSAGLFGPSGGFVERFEGVV
jgi:hypothetical protein